MVHCLWHGTIWALWHNLGILMSLFHVKLEMVALIKSLLAYLADVA